MKLRADSNCWYKLIKLLRFYLEISVTTLRTSELELLFKSFSWSWANFICIWVSSSLDLISSDCDAKRAANLSSLAWYTLLEQISKFNIFFKNSTVNFELHLYVAFLMSLFLFSNAQIRFGTF